MKYLVLLGDGMADYPMEELNGKTPLMVARTPAMDFLAANGTLGRVQTVPEGFPPGSDVANLSIMGYDPGVYYTGRAPLEAASLRIPLNPRDVAFRCNLVTLVEKDGDLIMEDFSAGHIPTDEARQVIAAIADALGNDEISFHAGVSYRHVMVWKDGNDRLQTTPPHDISGKPVSPYLPQGENARFITSLMERSREVLIHHPVNEHRRKEGRNPVTSIWLWGQGKALSIPSFQERYHRSGAVISAVDLIKGIGLSAGMETIDVPGATGFLDTNYRGKAEYALSALDTKDFVFVHVEAPDEAAHNGSLKDKIAAIEDFDGKVVATALEGIKQYPSFRILVLPDHATPISLMTHTADPVPFVIYPPVGNRTEIKAAGFNEASAAQTELFLRDGHKLMDFFIFGEVK